MEDSIRTTLDDDGAVTVAVLGEIDFSNADEVAQGIRDAVADWSPPTVHVDLRAATFIDSTGLGALIEGYRAATDQDTRFVVVNPSVTFRRVLTVTGLSDFFGLIETADSATACSARPAARRSTASRPPVPEWERPPSGETGVVLGFGSGGVEPNQLGETAGGAVAEGTRVDRTRR